MPKLMEIKGHCEKLEKKFIQLYYRLKEHAPVGDTTNKLKSSLQVLKEVIRKLDSVCFFREAADGEIDAEYLETLMDHAGKAYENVEEQAVLANSLLRFYQKAAETPKPC